MPLVQFQDFIGGVRSIITSIGCNANVGYKKKQGTHEKLNKSGPRVGPCGTSKRILLQELYVVFILALYLFFELFPRWDYLRNPLLIS